MDPAGPIALGLFLALPLGVAVGVPMLAAIASAGGSSSRLGIAVVVGWAMAAGFGGWIGGATGALWTAALIGAEGMLLVGISTLTERAARSVSIAQAASTAVGIALCLTPFWTNPLLQATSPGDGGPPRVIALAVGGNPLLGLAYHAAGIDLLRARHTYHASLLGSLYYAYPSPLMQAGALGLAGGVALLAVRLMPRRKA